MNLNTAIEHLGWVLIHSLWQFAAMALIAGGIAWALRRQAATSRYAVLVVGMAFVVAAPIVTWCVLPWDKAEYITATTSTTPPPEIMEPVAEPTRPFVAEPMPTAQFPSLENTPPTPIDVASSPPPLTIPEITRPWSETFAENLRPWMAWIVAGWSLGVVLCSLRPLIGWFTLRRLRTVGVAAVTDEVAHLFQCVSDRLGLRSVVTVLQSTLCQTPMVLGYFRPVILLPVSLLTNIPPAQLEAILAHELAHIRRHDFIINLLQTLVETLFFYHPAVWWLSRQIRVEREHCCDDLVIGAFNNRADYGRALIAIEELRGEQTVLALGVNNGSLLSRIRRIVGLRGDVPASSPWLSFVLVGCLLLTAAAVSMVNWSDASETNNDKANSEEKFVATLPDGTTVELLGVGPAETIAPQQCWAPDGDSFAEIMDWPKPFAPGLANGTHDLFVRCTGLGENQELGIEPIGWRSNPPVPDRGTVRRIGLAQDGKTATVSFGLTEPDWGPWQLIDAESAELIGPINIPLGYEEVYRTIQPTHVEQRETQTVLVLSGMPYRSFTNLWITQIVAIDREGKTHRPGGFVEPAKDQGRILHAEFHLPHKNIDHFEYRLRPYRYWVTFENISLVAGVKTDIKITVKETPKPIIPELPGGKSLEFVGITKNTAPVKDGWQPNGTPIGDVPNWKSTIVLHSGNTTSTYTEGQLTHNPDADAIDFLFRFRGLKAQPSLTFDLPANGSSYSHLPVADPYELRVSARKRGPHPPGGKWQTPEGLLRVGITDEPWGRWVKISPDGEVLDPIQPNELYASTYKLIDVVGTKPYERSPTGKTIELIEPASNTDPDDPQHRFAWEFRAVDTEGKYHGAILWESRGIEQTKLSRSQYGLSQPLPAGKTLSHYEYRLRPYRHWVTFENVSLEPGPQTDVKVTTRSVVFTPGEKLADQFATAMRAQKLPFLDDAKLAHLRSELEDVLLQRPPKTDWVDELFKHNVHEEFRARAEILIAANDVLQLTRYYYAGLKLPETTPEKWKRLTDGVAQFVQREFDPREKDTVYLTFRDRFETLKLFMAVFLASPDLTPDQARQLQDQRAWMKQEILKLPESVKFRLKHGDEIDKLQKLLDDPLNPFFSRPWTETEFAKVKELFAEKMKRDPSETRLNWAVTQLVSAIVELRSDRLRAAVPVRTYGWSRDGSRWRVLVSSAPGNSSLHLEDRRELGDSSYADLATMNFREKPPAKLEDHAAWLQQQGRGDLAYDAPLDAFVAVRGAKLAVLPATSWYAADIVPLAELKALLDREGKETVEMSTFVKPSTVGNNRVRDLREDAPSLVVRTQEGRIAVVRLFTFGPVIQCHLRPLPPNPPLHNGDVVPTQVRVLNANGQPATFNIVVSAQVGYPQKSVRPWMEWRDKSGLVSLETLPAGSHWILVAPEFEQRSLFHVTNPMPEKLIEWRLHRSEPWTKHDLEFKPRFEPDETTGGAIIVAIKNKFDKPLTVSEADFSLHVGERTMYRVMSPQWTDGKFQTVEIPARESGEIRLNWNEWVRRGFWASRDGEAIDEPVLPPNEPGRIYVRINLGNSGALPIAVTDPTLIFAEKSDPIELLLIGQKRLLTSKSKITSVRDFDPKIVEVKAIDPQTLSLTGVAFGLTVVTVTDENGEVFQQPIEVTAGSFRVNVPSQPIPFTSRRPLLTTKLNREKQKLSLPVLVGVSRELVTGEKIASVHNSNDKAVKVIPLGDGKLRLESLAPGQATLTVRADKNGADAPDFAWTVEVQIEALTHDRLREVFLPQSEKQSTSKDATPAADAQANLEQPVQFRGSVRDAQQRPVTRATVALSVVSGGDYELREKTVATTVVDESGAFTLPVAPSLLQRDNPRAALHLWAWRADVAQQGMTVVRIETPSDEPYVMTLFSPRTERVRLVDERGEPIRAVIEQLSLSMGFDLVLPEALARRVLSQREINGDFELQGFPAEEPDHHSVWLRSPERGRLHCQWRPEPKTAVTTLIWRDPVTIRGRLKAANGQLPAEVIQQAEITLTTHGDDSPQRVSWNVGHAKVRCDREGRFETHTLTPGSLQTEVDLPGITDWKRLNPKDAAGNSLVIKAENELEVDIVLARTRKLQGRFIDGEKNPLPGVELSIMHGQLQRTIRTDGGTATYADHSELVRTDAEGKFSLDIVPGLVSIGKQREPGSNLGTPVRWPATDKFMQPDGLLKIEPGEVPFVLPPVILATLAGRVIDQNERPLKGIVLASRGTPSEVTGMAACDEEGRFRLETMWEPERFGVLPHDAFNTLPPKEPNTDTILVTREPLVLQVVPKKDKADPPNDKRTVDPVAPAQRQVDDLARSVVTLTNPDGNKVQPNRRSGVIVDERGYALSIALSGDAVGDQFRVGHRDHTDVAAKVIKIDPTNRVLLLKLTPAPPLKAIALDNVSTVKEGERVSAIVMDQTRGETTGSVTRTGVALALGAVEIKGLIQTDFPLLPGDGGALLVNAAQQPAGLWYGIRAGKQRFGFAVPLQEVLPFVTENLPPKTAEGPRTSGTLLGRFVYDGEPPVPRELSPELSKAELDGFSSLRGNREERISGVTMTYTEYLRNKIRPKTTDPSLMVDKTGGIANVVIWVTNKNIPYVPKDQYLVPAAINVFDGHFHPRLTTMLAGQRLHVVNQDPVTFQFHADFQQNPGVNAILRPKQNDDPYRTVLKHAEKLPVRYRSDIATWADGYIVVRDNPYIAVSQSDGTFSMPDLPPGEWEFRVWHERRGYLAHWPKGLFTKKIEPGDNPLGNIRLKPELFAENTK